MDRSRFAGYKRLGERCDPSTDAPVGDLLDSEELVKADEIAFDGE